MLVVAECRLHIGRRGHSMRCAGRLKGLRRGMLHARQINPIAGALSGDGIKQASTQRWNT